MLTMSFDDTSLTHAVAALEKSERVGIALPKEPDLDCIASAEALIQGLTALGKQVGFITARPDAALAPLSDSELFTQVIQWPTLPKELVLLVDESVAPVSQIRYYKEDQRLRVVLTPQSRAVAQESISFHEGAITCDTALFLGVSSLESLKNILSAPTEFFSGITTLNIDTSQENTEYANHNLVTYASASLSELAYKFLTAMPSPVTIPAQSATMLLAGLMHCTNTFHKGEVSPESYTAAAELLHFGADHKTALRLVNGEKPIELLQFFGRASVRSRMDHDHRTLWSFVTDEDFLRTARTPRDVPALLAHLEAFFPLHETRVALWQDPFTKRVQILVGGDKTALQALSSRAPSQFAGHNLEFQSTFPSFTEAEQSATHALAHAHPNNHTHSVSETSLPAHI